MNMYLIWIGSNLKLWRSKESAIHRAMLQSSVHIPIFPDRASRFPFFICISTSWKSFFIRSLLFFTKGINYVEAPSASQIANPRKHAIALDSWIERPNFRTSIFSFWMVCFKSGANFFRSASSLLITLKVLYYDCDIIL